MSERVQNALNSFRNPYTCAQTIAAAFGKDDVDTLAHMKSCSGGRAPEGRCGALWAALQLAPEDKRTELAEAFARQAGSEKCREIKQGKHTTCQRCVEIAACWLDANLPE